MGTDRSNLQTERIEVPEEPTVKRPDWEDDSDKRVVDQVADSVLTKTMPLSFKLSLLPEAMALVDDLGSKQEHD